MPVITSSQSIAAGATVENLISGSFLEYLPRNSLLEIGVVALTGVLGDIRLDISSGGDILAENAAATVRSTGVNVDSDLYWEDTALAGERVKIRARNTSGGALVVQHFVRITYV